MVAKRFESYSQKDDFIIFASGVSNSKNSDLTAYQREAALLEKLIAEYPGKTLVYFSTCSLYDPGEKGSLYYLHKLRTSLHPEGGGPLHYFQGIEYCRQIRQSQYGAQFLLLSPAA